MPWEWGVMLGVKIILNILECWGEGKNYSAKVQIFEIVQLKYFNEGNATVS